MSQTKIDDQDLSRVKYNGTWIRGGSPSEFDGTVASSTRVSDSFTVSFTGNLIGVYGTIDITSGGVLTNYSVDGASPAQVTSQAGSGDTFNQQFWNSPTLNEGDHELLVTMVKVNPDSQPGEGTIWFDYFLATDPRIQSNPNKSKNIGAIVGGVIGGVFFLIVIVALALVALRRRNSRHLEHASVQPWTEKEVKPVHSLPASSTHPTVEPFRETNPTSVSITATHKPTLSIASSSTPTSSTGPNNLNVIISNPVSRKGQGDLTVPASESSSNALPESSIQHVDSGVRVGNLDPLQASASARVELPPVYSPV